MRDKDMPFPPPVPQPKPIETRRIYREIVIKVAKEARQELFEEEKEKTYHAICNAAYNGCFNVTYRFSENCDSTNIIALKNELVEKGFEVELKNGVTYSLEILWYDEQ
jgi:hypothetical protein